ncbi:multiheme c-type cytochrome [Deferrisoma sp.]
MRDLKTRGVEVVVLDGGNALFPRAWLAPSEREPWLAKARCLVEGHRALGLDLQVVGAYDLAAGVEPLKEWAETAGYPFISGNLVDAETQEPVFAPFIVLDRGGVRVGFLGVTDPRASPKALGERYRVAPTWHAVRRWLPELTRRGCDAVLVVGAVHPKEFRVMARTVPGVTAYLAGDPRDRLMLPWRVGDAWIVGASQLGKFLTLVSLDPKPDGWGLRHRFVPLRPEFPECADVRRIVDAYYRRAGLWRWRGREIRDMEVDVNAEGLEPVFAGASACGECHPRHAEAWRDGRHARALGLLRGADRKNPECLRCHTTGFGTPAGYRLGTKSRSLLAGVQCEACHGPGSLHPAAEISRGPRDAAEACAECHRGDHGEGFKLASALRRIACARVGPEPPP